MKAITWIIPYYRALPMLRRQLEHYATYSEETLRHITWIYIDGCSPLLERPDDVIRAAPKRIRERIELLRVVDDIPWNQHGARNLGAHLAKTDWLLMTDMDRALTAYDVKRLLEAKLEPKCYYKPVGLALYKDFPRSDNKIPANQFLVTRKAYWSVGGYDEDYCGSYGGDKQFLDALSKRVELKVMRDIRLLRYQDEVLPGAECPLGRKDSEYQKEFTRRVLHKRTKGREHDPHNENLRFRWHAVELGEAPPIGEFIGEGKSREVFQHADNPALVVKIAKEGSESAITAFEKEWNAWQAAQGTVWEPCFAPITARTRTWSTVVKCEPCPEIHDYPIPIMMEPDPKCYNFGILDGRMVMLDPTFFPEEMPSKLKFMDPEKSKAILMKQKTRRDEERKKTAEERAKTGKPIVKKGRR